MKVDNKGIIGMIMVFTEMFKTKRYLQLPQFI